jgi:glucosamine-phosphate N-acetyltransferase
MIIREFQKEDVNKGLLKTYQEVWKIDEITDETVDRYLTNGNYMAVAEDNNEIIGTATLHFQHKIIRNGGVAAFIEDVAVREKYRGHGIGAKLIEHLIENAKSYGCYKINLSCFPERVAFYERCGLKQESITMRYYL